MTTENTHTVDPNLLEQAKQLGGHQTELETLNEALKEYIRWRFNILERLILIRRFWLKWIEGVKRDDFFRYAHFVSRLSQKISGR